MYLEKLEIQGFKSFAEKTTLLFPKENKGKKSNTAIVGPNGSGKSNIADAVRWVLGEQSIKHLRGKKSEDVIFSGSEKRSALGMAEVSLYLNNEDSSAPIDYSELVITRKLYRSGESEYLINKNKARLSDIQMLLAKANFGQRTYSIIGQGMVDSILIASLQERKEFFDEAVGVKQFQIKKEQALNKFKSTRENLAQVELTLKEIEPRLKSLQRQVKRLEKRKEVEKELTDLQIKYFSKTWNDLTNQIQVIEEEKSIKDDELTKVENKLKELEQKINSYGTSTDNLEKQRDLQHKYHSLLEDKNKQLRSLAFLKGQKDLDLQKQGKQELVWLNQKNEEIDSKIKLKNEDLENTKKELDNLKETEKQTVFNLENIVPKISSLEKEINEIKAKPETDFDQKSELKTIFSLQQDLVTQLSEVTSIEELEEIKTAAKEINQKLSLYIEKIDQDTKEHKQLETLTNLQNQLNRLLEEKNQISLELQRIKLQISQKQEEIIYKEQEILELDQEKERLLQELKKAQITDKKEFSKEIDKESQEIESNIEKLETEISKVSNELSDWQEKEQKSKEKILGLQKEFQTEQNIYHQLSNQVNSFEVEMAKLTTKKEELEKEIFEELNDLSLIQGYQAKEEINPQELYPKIIQLKKQLDIIGGIDPETQEEHEEISERYNFLSNQFTDLTKALEDLEQVIEELDETIKKQFDKTFKQINTEFQRYFAMLFNGGKANLVKITSEAIKKELKEEESDEESEEEEEEKEDILAKTDKFLKMIKQKEKESYAGIEIQACPPGKKLTSINMLSGGEKALTSIGLICAIISVSPSPFIVLDEVDAALDEANSQRFAMILGELSNKTQFVVITHNRASMHQANVLYGVTMGSDSVSHLLSVELEQAESMVNR